MLLSRRFWLGTTLVLSALAPTGGARAAQPATPPAGSTTTASLCRVDPARETSALTFLACRLRDGLPKLAASTVIVSRALQGGSDAGGPAFAQRLTQFLSSATGSRDGGVTAGNTAGAATSASNAEAPVLLLEPQVRGTLVEVNATLLGNRANVWARVRGETNMVLAHAFASGVLNAELRSYLPPTPLVRPAVRAYSAPVDQINAIACGDMDADGALEVAVSNRRLLALGHLTEAGLVVEHQVTLRELSDVAPVPLREPLASLWFHGPTLEVSSTDRHFWVSVDRELRVLSKGANQWGVGPGWCAARSAVPPEAQPFVCTLAPVLSEATAPLLDRQVTHSEGFSAPPVVAWRDASTGAVTVAAGTKRWTLPARGAQLALADSNNDGVLEVLTTSPSFDRAADHLLLHNLPLDGGAPIAAWDVPVPTGVDAVAICPLVSGAASAVLYASGDQVGVVL